MTPKTAEKVRSLSSETDWAFPGPSYVPTRILFGAGALDGVDDVLAEIVTRFRARKLLLILGHQSPDKTWQKRVQHSVAAYPHLSIENTTTNPTIDSVEEILAQARKNHIDLVIGIGGGSVLDSAKAVAALVRENISLREALLGKKKSFAAVPLIAIPTTAGTGSEVTPSATVWDKDDNIKYSLSSPELYPVTAIVDPLLTLSVPAHVIASTGLDALAHGVESCWSVNSTEESVRYGLRAVSTLVDNLEKAVAFPFDKVAREHIASASLQAGLSIARAQTTIAHAISYPLTLRYGLPHGHACGVSLGPLLRFNCGVADADCQDRRGLGHVQGTIARLLDALQVTDGVAGERRILSLIRNIRLPLFSDYPDIDLGAIATDVVAYDRFQNNPRIMSQEQVRVFLNSLHQSR